MGERKFFLQQKRYLLHGNWKRKFVQELEEPAKRLHQTHRTPFLIRNEKRLPHNFASKKKKKSFKHTVNFSKVLSPVSGMVFSPIMVFFEWYFFGFWLVVTCMLTAFSFPTSPLLLYIYLFVPHFNQELL